MLERFEALQQCAVPLARRFTPTQREESRRLVESFLEERGPSVRRKVGLFLRVVDLVCLLRHGRTFRKLDGERQKRVLGGLERSRVALFRKGAWGLVTLAKLGAYGQAATYSELGYRPREKSP